MEKKKGQLIISLDFELFWGVTDSRTTEGYGQDIIEGRKAIPCLLELFEKYDVHATWGTVGMIFAENKKELKKYIPELQPNYYNSKLSAYKYLESIEPNKEYQDLYFAPSLIKQIINYETQEIGSHTFCHYYCREKGQDCETFDADTKAAREIAKDIFNIDIKSFIFPRNHFNSEYLKSLRDNNIIAIRGNPNHFAYNDNKKISRLFRFIDAYIPICGSKSYYKAECYQDGMVNLKASIFFRKYNKTLCFLEPLKIWNIKHLMKIAAKKGKIIHIWWHPHNMGSNPREFLKQIEKLLIYFKKLNNEYGFESKNMGEFAEEIINEKNCDVM